MLLNETTAQMQVALWTTHGTPISYECARTIASWWCSPTTPGLQCLVCTGDIRHDLRVTNEIESEMSDMSKYSEDRKALEALLDYVNSN